MAACRVNNLRRIGGEAVANAERAQAIAQNNLDKLVNAANKPGLSPARRAELLGAPAMRQARDALRRTNANLTREYQNIDRFLAAGRSAATQCFTADMLALTKRGMVRFDELQPGDLVGSCDEMNPFGEIEWKPVEEIFRTRALIWHVHVNGEVIRTTGGHPFYVCEKGWTEARNLEPGDRLRSHDGQTVAVDDVYNTGQEEVVYNCRVADYHTYFVAAPGAKAAVWAHNVCSVAEVMQATGMTQVRAQQVVEAARKLGVEHLDVVQN